MRLEGPVEALIVLIRLNEYATSAAVTLSPFEKNWPGFTVQT